MRSFIISTLAAITAAQEYYNFGDMVYDALVSIDVDVDGFMDFVTEKGIALDEMSTRHEQEVEDFFVQMEIEAEENFADDAQRIQDAVIGAVQDWAASLDEMAPLKRASIIKKAEKNLKHRSGKARRQEGEMWSWSNCRND